MDLFIATGEMSGDLHGAKLIHELLAQRPNLQIGAVAGPKMRELPITEFFPMESLRVMGFIDVFLALPKLARQFFAIRNQILKLNPKAVVFIDYPGLHLRLARSLRKKGFKGKLVHFICPTVWAWGKKRIPQMAKTLDLLLTLFPFEKKCFAHTKLPVQYVGHPLALSVSQFKPSRPLQGKILGLFPGSRKTEIEKNLPIQLAAARKLKKLDPSLQIAISMTQFPMDAPDAIIVPPDQNYELMRSSRLALATSGTVTLELALHATPTVVNFAIKPLDCFIATRILKINLPYYCIANIVIDDEAFPELYGPRLNEETLFAAAQKLWFDENLRKTCIEKCHSIKNVLGEKRAAYEAALAILETVHGNSSGTKRSIEGDSRSD